LTCTTEVARKPLPVTDNTKVGLPAKTEGGARLVMLGRFCEFADGSMQETARNQTATIVAGKCSLRKLMEPVGVTPMIQQIPAEAIDLSFAVEQ
jgi:hypothetical protein